MGRQVHAEAGGHQADQERAFKAVSDAESVGKEQRMSAKEMLEQVQMLKEQTVFNGFEKPVDADKFWNENWISILDILDDALYEYLNK